MSKEKKVKIKVARQYTRAQALRGLAEGRFPPSKFYLEADPFRRHDPKNLTEVGNHPNYHVRARCYKMLGSPVMADPADQAKLLASLHIKEKVVEEAPVESMPELVGDGHTDDSAALQAQVEAAMVPNPSADTP